MNTEIELSESKSAELSSEVSAIVLASKEFVIIRDDDHCQSAIEFGKNIKARRKFVDEFMGPLVTKAHELHKSLTTKRNMLDDPLKQAETTVRSSVGRYEDAKRAEIEAKRRAEEAEARRIAEAAEAERQKEIARMRKAEEDRRLEKAAALEAEGKVAQAQQVIEAPVVFVQPPPVAAPVIMTPRYVPPAGTTGRTNWKHRIVDKSLIPANWMIPDEQAIGAYARSMKENASIPGVEFYSEVTRG